MLSAGTGVIFAAYGSWRLLLCFLSDIVLSVSGPVYMSVFAFVYSMAKHTQMRDFFLWGTILTAAAAAARAAVWHVLFRNAPSVVIPMAEVLLWLILFCVFSFIFDKIKK